MSVEGQLHHLGFPRLAAKLIEKGVEEIRISLRIAQHGLDAGSQLHLLIGRRKFIDRGIAVDYTAIGEPDAGVCAAIYLCGIVVISCRCIYPVESAVRQRVELPYDEIHRR